MTSGVGTASHGVLPRLGSGEEFAAVRQLLQACGFDEPRVSGRLAIADIAHFKSVRQGRATALDFQSPLDVLIRLFLDGEVVREGVVASHLPAGAAGSLAALNLVTETADGWRSTILLYPGFGLWTASDRSDEPLPPDAVYPAVIENTREFIAALPESPCETLLDLGTGSGIAALLAASGYAGQSWGVDITARAVHFAEFNRRLNCIANVKFLEGDMYAPVEGLSFDRIVAHPPYVPAAKTHLIYRDGGEDGEQLLRASIEGLPRFLRPGGTFYATAMAADCEGETVEQRIRKWLGESREEFDLVLVSHWLREPERFIAGMHAKGNVPAAETAYLEELWKRRKVQFLVRGGIVLRRFAESRPAITARAQKGTEMTREHVQWLLDWETRARNPASLEWLMSLRPSIPPQCRLLVQHLVHEGRFVPRDFLLACPSPFNSECRVEAWLAAAVSRCDGRKTLRGQVDDARRGGAPGSYQDDDVTAIFITLISAGILTVAAA
jgi:SAM-dependent methyltransferase